VIKVRRDLGTRARIWSGAHGDQRNQDRAEKREAEGLMADSCAGSERAPGENRVERLRAEEVLVGEVTAALAKTKAAYGTSNLNLAQFLGRQEGWVEDFFRGYVRVGVDKRSPTLREVAQVAHVMDQQVRISLEYIAGGYVQGDG
jgi:hypothetical protein